MLKAFYVLDCTRKTNLHLFGLLVRYNVMRLILTQGS